MDHPINKYSRNKDGEVVEISSQIISDKQMTDEPCFFINKASLKKRLKAITNIYVEFEWFDSTFIALEKQNKIKSVSRSKQGKKSCNILEILNWNMFHNKLSTFRMNDHMKYKYYEILAIDKTFKKSIPKILEK